MPQNEANGSGAGQMLRQTQNKLVTKRLIIYSLLINVMSLSNLKEKNYFLIAFLIKMDFHIFLIRKLYVIIMDIINILFYIYSNFLIFFNWLTRRQLQSEKYAILVIL